MHKFHAGHYKRCCMFEVNRSQGIRRKLIFNFECDESHPDVSTQF